MSGRTDWPFGPTIFAPRIEPVTPAVRIAVPLAFDFLIVGNTI
jgi:hypothetical protein